MSDLSLPGDMPLVAQSVDSIVGIRSRQNLFISSHAAQLVAAISAAGDNPSLSRWSLHGLPMTSRDALDQVRQAPDLLSFMRQLPRPREESVRFFTALRNIISPLRSEEKAGKKRYSMDDLEFVVSSSEATEIACKILCVSSNIISAPVPRLGEGVYAYSAHELKSSSHRSTEGSLFLVVHTTRESRGVPGGVSGRSSAQVLSAEISLHMGRSGLLAEFDGLEYGHEAGSKSQSKNASAIRQMERESVYIGEAVKSIEIMDGDAVSDRAATLMETLVLPLLKDANDRLTDVVVRRLEDNRESAIASAKSKLRREAIEADRSSRLEKGSDPESVGLPAPVSVVDSTIRRMRIAPSKNR